MKTYDFEVKVMIRFVLPSKSISYEDIFGSKDGNKSVKINA